MKPTSGSSSSGNTMQKQQTTTLSADQAYQLVGLLIVEGRMPHTSLKGRIEGPHATKTDVHTRDDHMCSHENSLCKNAERYSQQLSRTGQTLMPVSVEVLLLPECESGQQAANAATTETDAQDCCSILLERWHIEVSHNRSREGALSLKMLMQAVRSYLGFSQLSAWYVRSGGQQPKHVVYRIAVLDGADSPYRNPNASQMSPNCSSGGTSIMEYEQLAFPNVMLANELLLTVSLSALKRQTERPVVHCRLATCGECHKRMAAGSGTQAPQPTPVLPSSPPSPPRMLDEVSKSMPARSDPSGTRGSPSPSPNDTIVPVSSTQSSSLSLSVSTVSSLSPTIEDSSVSGENAERFAQPLVVSSSKSDTPSLLAVSSAARRCLVFTDDNQNVRTPTSPSDGLPGDTKRCGVDGGAQMRKSKMRNERKILFSDSSSNESLDRLEFRAGRDRRWSPAVSSSTNAPSTLLATTSALVRPTDSRSSPTRTEESDLAAPQKDTVPTASVPVKVSSECETTSATVKLRSQSVSESIDTANVVNERMPRRRSSKSISTSKSSVRPPSDSSPAPLVRASTGRFDYVAQPLRRCGLSLPSPLAAGLSDLARSAPSSSIIRSNRLSGLIPTESAFGDTLDDEHERSVPPSGCDESRTAAPPATASGYVVAQNLVVNFEESLLNGRISPSGSIDGFSVTLSAAGAQFSTPHVSLPVTAEFFRLSDDNSPSPYLGRVELGAFGKHGFRVPSHGVLQVTLFNPNSTVMKMFVVVYDLSAMPPSSQTFLRQRTYYMPVKPPAGEHDSTPRRRSVSSAPNAQQPEVDLGQLELPSYLRYVIHLRLQTSKRGHLHLHKDIRMIIARDSFEFDPQVARYELRSILEQPTNPTFSPIR